MTRLTTKFCSDKLFNHESLHIIKLLVIRVLLVHVSIDLICNNLHRLKRNYILFIFFVIYPNTIVNN